MPHVPKIVRAVGPGVWATALGGGPSGVLPALAALVASASACVLMWALGVLANHTALTHVEFDGWAVVSATQNLARVPVPLFGPVLRVVLTAAIPVAFLATVPAQLFFGAASLWLALVSALLTGGAVALTSYVWRRELLRYSGPMG